jgi:hypothetical protein
VISCRAYSSGQLSPFSFFHLCQTSLLGQKTGVFILLYLTFFSFTAASALGRQAGHSKHDITSLVDASPRELKQIVGRFCFFFSLRRMGSVVIFYFFSSIAWSFVGSMAYHVC